MDSLAHIHGNGPAAQRDPVQSLAYQIAWSEVMLNRGRVSREGPTARVLQNLASNLSAADLQRAQDSAAALLKACCGDVRNTSGFTLKAGSAGASPPASGPR